MHLRIPTFALFCSLLAGCVTSNPFHDRSNRELLCQQGTKVQELWLPPIEPYEYPEEGTLGMYKGAQVNTGVFLALRTARQIMDTTCNTTTLKVVRGIVTWAEARQAYCTEDTGAFSLHTNTHPDKHPHLDGCSIDIVDTAHSLTGNTEEVQEKDLRALRCYRSAMAAAGFIDTLDANSFVDRAHHWRLAACALPHRKLP